MALTPWPSGPPGPRETIYVVGKTYSLCLHQLREREIDESGPGEQADSIEAPFGAYFL
jgi:hypothetical protein